MKKVFVVAASTVFGAAAVVSSAPANAKVRVVPFAKSGSWNVRAVYGSSGRFDHCSANARYQSGTRVSIIVYRSGNWRLWFSNKVWPDRGRETFPAVVKVDGRVVLRRTGNFKGRSAFVDLGRDVARVRALMRGRSMAISTPSGTSRFKLTGTNQATQQIARCWKAHYKRSTPNSGVGGAFGSANNSATGGAFGGGVARSRNVNQLSRGQTLEIATSYLSKASQSYSILPKNKAILKHFPVNWRFQDGTIGGIRVFKNTSADPGVLLGTLLSNQAKRCKGRNASKREQPKVLRGRRIARASGVCETSKGNVLNISYKVAELGRRMVMMIMEVRSAGRTAGARDGAASDNEKIIVPKPNEL